MIGQVRAAATLLWRVSLGEFRARPLRAALFVVAIALGVAMTTAMYTAVETAVAGFESDLDEVAGTADLQITFGGGQTGFPEAVVDSVRAQPYVRHAAAVVRGALGFVDGSGQTLELFGVDVLQHDILEMYGVSVLDRTADDFEIINDPFGLFVTEKVASERALRVGGRVRLSGVAGTNDYTVRGILAFGGLADAYGGDVAVMYLPAAQAVAGKVFGILESNVDQIDVSLSSGVQVDQARRNLLALLGPGMVVEEPLQRRLASRRVLGGLRATLIGISAFVLLAATFVIYSTTNTFVVQRTPALASLLMTGATPATLVMLVLIEAAVLGAIGALIGAFGGVFMSAFLVEDVAYGMSLNYGLISGTLPEAGISRGVVFGAFLLGVAAALVAAWVPARRLGRLDPLLLIRGGPGAWSLSNGPRRPYPILAPVLFAAGVLAVVLGVRAQSALLCSGGGIGLITGLTLSLLPAVRQILAGPVKRLLARAGASAWMAGEQLEQDASRSVATIAVIALCIAAVVTAASLPRSFRSSVSHWYGFSGDVIVSSRSVRGGWLSAPVAASLTDQLETLSSVAGTDTLRVIPDQRYRGRRVAVAGLSAGLIERALASATEVDGDDPGLAGALIGSGRAVAVATNMARPEHVRPGDRLRLDSPTGPVELPVAAIVPDFVSDAGSVVLSAELVKERWRDGLVNYVAVHLREGAGLSELRAEIAESVALAPSLSVMSSASMRARIDGYIKRAFDDVSAIQLLTIFVTLAGIIDLLVSSVVDRKRSMALLLVAGATERDLVRSAALEASAIGVTAGLLGGALGCLYSWVWIRFTYPVLVGYVLDLDLAWASVAGCIAMTLLTAMLTGWFASRATLRTTPLEAINVG